MSARTILVAATLALSATTIGCFHGCPHHAHDGGYGPGPYGGPPPPPPGPPGAAAQAAPPAAHPQRPPGSEHLYRLDFTVTSTEAGKASSSSAYSVSVEDNGHGELRIGQNVPLGGAANAIGPRQDVGLLIRAGARPSGNDVLLDVTTELSAMEDGGALRKLSAHGDVVAAPGAAAQVASLEDPTSHKRYAITVTATKLK